MTRPFVFVLHHHQPIGNTEAVMRSAYETCYRPLLDALDAHPKVKATLHYSGALLEWLKRETPELVERVKTMVAAGRVEVLGGAFYDPVLTQLPDHDAHGQIEMMGMFCERYFGVRPQGVWLAERVYDPDLPRLLAPAGAKYTFVDDSHFRSAGLDEGGATGHWMTERAGQPLGIFPIARRLRYAIPFHAPEDAVRSIADGPGEGALVYADDAEKLGFWPETHEWVFEKGWLDRFFTALEQAQSDGSVSTMLPAEIAARPPEGRVYLAGGGYEELERWAGGSFSAFLARYPEADRMHKRMLRVSERLQAQMEAAIGDSETGRLEGDVGDLLGTAQRELYRGQCACAYWHGLFGGLYLGHLRRAVYRALIHADGILDELAQGGDDYLAYEERDVDLCGHEEVVVSNRVIDVVAKPSAGGTMATELDDKRTRTAIADTVARHREPYHADIDPAPPTDDEPRALFVDRVLPKGASKAVITEPKTHDLAGLSRRAYEVVRLGVVREGEGDDAPAAIELVMKTAAPEGGSGLALAVEKTLRVPMESAKIEARYTIENVGDALIEGVFAVESTTSFVGAPGDADGKYSIDEDAGTDLVFRAENGRIEYHGLEGLTRREDGIAPTLLGRVTMCLFDLSLAPGAKRSLSVTLTLS